jgi:hypothetical protein
VPDERVIRNAQKIKKENPDATTDYLVDLLQYACRDLPIDVSRPMAVLALASSGVIA